MMIDTYLFDIDGTLADCSPRLHYIQGRPKHWGKFFDGIPNDEPILPTVNILKNLNLAYSVVLFTGRPEYTMSDTCAWLEKYDIPYDGLIMRDPKDRRPDTVVKLGLADSLKTDRNIIGIFEDRVPVIKALRGAGYFVYDVEQKRVDFE